MSLIAQPDGLPLHYIRRLVGQAAWTKYSVIRKQQRGLLDKVLHVMISILVLITVSVDPADVPSIC